MSNEFEPIFQRGKGKFGFSSLTPAERRELVKLSSGAVPSAGTPYTIDVTNLELTALGANAELSGHWGGTESGSAPTLTAWYDQGQGGRTVRSVTVHKGFLFPLGHRATVTTLIERVIAAAPSGQNSYGSPNQSVAYLQRRVHISVSQPLKLYSAPFQPFDEEAGGTSDWPFVSVRMVTLVSPALSEEASLLGTEKAAFWPMLGPDEPMEWSFIATDRAGNDVHFQMPLAFAKAAVERGPNVFEATWPEKLAAKYNTAHEEWRYSVTAGAPVQFAPEAKVGGQTLGGQTTHPMLLAVLGAATSGHDANAATKPPNVPSQQQLEKAGQPNFYPTIQSARLRLHGAEAITGTSFSDEAHATPGVLPKVGGVQFRYLPTFVSMGSNGFGTSKPSEAAARRLLERAAQPRHDAVRPDAQCQPGDFLNLGSVYAEAVNAAPLNLPASAVGALGTPNSAVAGLSAAQGIVGGKLEEVTAGAEKKLEQERKSIEQFAEKGFQEIDSFFSKIESNSIFKEVAPIAELLGIELQKLLAEAEGLPAQIKKEAEQTISEWSDKYGCSGGGSSIRADDGGPEGTFEMPTLTTQLNPLLGPPTIKYELNTPLKKYGGIFAPDEKNGEGGEPRLKLAAEVVEQLPADPPSFKASGSLDPFTICLLKEGDEEEFIKLHFSSFSFSAGSTGKPTVNIKLDNVEFVGALSFVETLQEFLESLGLGGPTIDIQPTLVSIGTTFEVPPQALGIFTLSGIGFSGGVELPLLGGGKPSSHFSFASKHKPFTLTVSCFGGGGFLSTILNFSGVELIEGQFEFAGQLGFDVAVANGMLSVEAGIYFKYSSSKGCEISGFVRLFGELEVLGIISISAELAIMVNYESTTHAVEGTAALHAHISVAFFSATVSIEIHKSFGGSGSRANAIGADHQRKSIGAAEGASVPLVWENLISEPQWALYSSAFAGEA